MTEADVPSPTVDGALLTQLRVGHVRDLFDVVSRPGGGVVLTGKSPRTLLSEKARLVDSGFAGPILLDIEGYAGAARRHVGTGLDLGWIAAQQRAGVSVVLADVGYAAPDNPAGLVAALSSVANLRDPSVYACVALSPPVLAGADRLVELAVELGVPLAVVLESSTDPLSATGLAGLLHIVRSLPGSMWLRADVSALGALALGLRAAAVGVQSTLRHLFPAGGRGGRTAGSTSALLPACLSLMYVDKIAAGVGVAVGDARWDCPCVVCDGRTLDRLILVDGDVEARRHTHAALLSRRDALFDNEPRDRPVAWKAWVNSAISTFEEIRADGVDWTTPPVLNHWSRQVRVPTRVS